MLQVYVFKLSTLPEESMHEIRLAGMAYDGRDVYIIFVNARSLTGRLVVEHILSKALHPMDGGCPPRSHEWTHSRNDHPPRL